MIKKREEIISKINGVFIFQMSTASGALHFGTGTVKPLSMKTRVNPVVKLKHSPKTLKLKNINRIIYPRCCSCVTSGNFWRLPDNSVTVARCERSILLFHPHIPSHGVACSQGKGKMEDNKLFFLILFFTHMYILFYLLFFFCVGLLSRSFS